MTLPPPWPEPVLVVVPTYNEVETLPAVLGRLQAAVPGCDVLVVDDGSPDGTAAVAAEWAARDPRVHLLRRSAKRGLGAAYKAGFGWGLERGYEVFVEMDADGSHAPEQLPRLLTPLAWADLVIGSRYVTGGGVTNWPAHRRLLSHAGNAYTRLALGLPVADSTAGFRVFRRTALEAIDYRGVESQGYCFQVDMTRRAVHAGLDVVEVPITFVERESGQSKMTTAIVGEALWRVTQWGVTDRLARADRLLGRGPRRRDRAASLGGATRLGGRRSAEGGAAAPTVRQSCGPDGSGRWARRGS